MSRTVFHLFLLCNLALLSRMEPPRFLLSTVLSLGEETNRTQTPSSLSVVFFLLLSECPSTVLSFSLQVLAGKHHQVTAFCLSLSFTLQLIKTKHTFQPGSQNYGKWSWMWIRRKSSSLYAWSYNCLHHCVDFIIIYFFERCGSRWKDDSLLKGICFS